MKRTARYGGKALLAAQDTDTVSFTIPNEDGSIPIDIDKDAVESGQTALERIAIRAVPFLSRAGHELDLTGLDIDHPNAVAFRVGQPGISIFVQGNPLGAFELRQLGRPAMAAKAALARSGDVLDDAALHVELKDLISLARGEPQISLFVKIETARAFQRRAGDRRAVWRWARLAGARECPDLTGAHVQLSNHMIADVADVESPFWTELDAVRLSQLGFTRRSAIPAIAWLTRAGDGGDDP